MTYIRIHFSASKVPNASDNNFGSCSVNSDATDMAKGEITITVSLLGKVTTFKRQIITSGLEPVEGIQL